jgi:hypothetical protein
MRLLIQKILINEKRFESNEDAHKRGFAASIWANESDSFACADAK